MCNTFILYNSKLPPMLTFIGIGLYDEKDISIKGLEAVRAADRVYIEFYTSTLSGTSIGLAVVNRKKTTF